MKLQNDSVLLRLSSSNSVRSIGQPAISSFHDPVLVMYYSNKLQLHLVTVRIVCTGLLSTRNECAV